MTVQEAYKNVVDFFEGEEKIVPSIIREYDDMYGFYLAPENAEPDEPIFVGSMICCMKEDGSVIFADEIEDQGFYRKPWKDIPPKEVLGEQEG